MLLQSHGGSGESGVQQFTLVYQLPREEARQGESRALFPAPQAKLISASGKSFHLRGSVSLPKTKHTSHPPPDGRKPPAC